MEIDETRAPDAGGISRRDLIAKSVVAGGLVWASPVVLSGRAGAESPCCVAGTPITVKVPEAHTNCGQPEGCQELIYACDDDLANCLDELNLVVGHYDHGQIPTGSIKLAPGVTLISASVKSQDRCFYTDCVNTVSATDVVNPNGCKKNSAGSPPCDTSGSQAPNPPLPPAVGGMNRIWLEPDPDVVGGTIVRINLYGEPFNPSELSICVGPEVTGMCP